jgi:archaemetzincin
VNTARYHPALDTIRVEKEHAWPGSHCEDYIAKCCVAFEAPAGRHESLANPGDREANFLDSGSHSPLPAAISAHHSLPQLHMLAFGSPESAKPPPTN